MFKPLCAALAALVLVSCGGGGSGSDTVGSTGATGGTNLMLPLSRSGAPGGPARHAGPPVLQARPASLVNTSTVGDQALRTVGATSDGGYVVAWIATGDFLYMQAYDEDGVRVGSEVHIQVEIPAPTQAANRVAIEQSAVSVLTDGSVVVLYTVTRDVPISDGFVETVTGLFFQLLGQDGRQLVPETQVTSQAFAGPKGPYLGMPRVAALADGGFVVSSALQHDSTLFGSISGLSLYWFDARGVPAGSPVPVGEFPELQRYGYAMVADARGGLTLSTTHTSAVYQPLYTAFHYDSSHTADTIVGPRGGPVSLLPLEKGYVLFTAGSEVTIQRLDGQGNPVGAPRTVASFPYATRELADGTYVVIWSANGGYAAQQFAARGTSLGEPLPMATLGGAPGLAALAEPGFVAAWTAPGINRDADVYAQIFIEQPGNTRQRCLDGAKGQGLKGKERKAFVDACVARE